MFAVKSSRMSALHYALYLLDSHMSVAIVNISWKSSV